MADNQLNPLNDFVRKVYIEDVDPVTYDPVPATSGSVTGFLAVSNAPDAVAADPTLSVSGTHIGAGVWGFEIDATVLTAALLASLYASATPYFIVYRVGGIRAYERLQYVAARPATIV